MPGCRTIWWSATAYWGPHPPSKLTLAPCGVDPREVAGRIGSKHSLRLTKLTKSHPRDLRCSAHSSACLSVCQHQYSDSQMRGIGLQNWRWWDDKFLRNCSRLPKTMTQVLGWLDNPPMRTTVRVNGKATSSVSPSWLVYQREKLLT